MRTARGPPAEHAQRVAVELSGGWLEDLRHTGGISSGKKWTRILLLHTRHDDRTVRIAAVGDIHCTKTRGCVAAMLAQMAEARRS